MRTQSELNQFSLHGNKIEAPPPASHMTSASQDLWLVWYLATFSLSSFHLFTSPPFYFAPLMSSSSSPSHFIRSFSLVLLPFLFVFTSAPLPLSSLFLFCISAPLLLLLFSSSFTPLLPYLLLSFCSPSFVHPPTPHTLSFTLFLLPSSCPPALPLLFFLSFSVAVYCQKLLL